MNIIKTRCFDFKLHDRDVGELKKEAQSFIDQLERKTGQLGDLGEILLRQDRSSSFSLEEIDEALRSFLSKKYPGRIINTTVAPIDFSSCGLGKADGCIVTFTNAKFYGCMVLIDKSISSLEPDLKKEGQAPLVYAYSRALKSIYLHEIGHVLLCHDNFSLQPKTSSKVLSSFVSKHAVLDAQCDVLSYVLAFWPFVGKDGFKTLVDKAYKSWDGFDFRLRMANMYKMPINSVAQWIVIMLTDPYRVHYARLAVSAPSPGQVVDWYDCKDVVNSIAYEDGQYVGMTEDEAAKQLFLLKNEKTSAQKALAMPHGDQKMVHQDVNIRCAAFYERAQYAYNRLADEVVVFGLAPQV